MRKLAGLHIIFLGLLALGFTAAHAQKVETVDGIRRVHNDDKGKWGENPQLSLEFVKNLGELDSDDENILFHMPTDIAFDSQGNIYVLDQGNQRIQKFDAAGKYLATIGRQGEGPGELQFPMSLDIDAKGYIYVPDTSNQRLQIYTPEGIDHKGITMDRGALGPLRLLSDGRMLKGAGGMMTISPGAMNDKAPPPPLLKLLDAAGEEIKEFCVPHDYKEFITNMMGNRVHFALDTNDNIYVAFDYQNRIDKYSPEGGLIWRADRKLNYDTKKPVSKGSRSGGGGRIAIQAPQMNRASQGIAVDQAGRIWVVGLERQIKEEEQVNMSISRSMGGGGRSTQSVSVSGNTDLTTTDMYRLEVYDPEGVLLGIFPLTHFVDDIRINKDRIFLLDRLRGAQFYEYKISE
jgi:hypothetical protein